jgi:hypothetical protein
VFWSRSQLYFVHSVRTSHAVTLREPRNLTNSLQEAESLTIRQFDSYSATHRLWIPNAQYSFHKSHVVQPRDRWIHFTSWAPLAFLLAEVIIFQDGDTQTNCVKTYVWGHLRLLVLITLVYCGCKTIFKRLVYIFVVIFGFQFFFYLKSYREREKSHVMPPSLCPLSNPHNFEPLEYRSNWILVIKGHSIRRSVINSIQPASSYRIWLKPIFILPSSTPASHTWHLFLWLLEEHILGCVHIYHVPITYPK